MKLHTTYNKILLTCGMCAGLFYIVADIFSATQFKGYNYVDQTISELSAIGAPTRPLWVALTFIFNPLLITFGVGLWRYVQKRSLRITGVLISLWGAIGFIWYFFPMNMRGAIGSTTDTMHLVMAAITVPLMMLFIGMGSGAQGKWFRIYSIMTIATMLFFGGWTATQAPKVAAQLSTPGLGILERLSVYPPMIWIFVLARIFYNKKST